MYGVQIEDMYCSHKNECKISKSFVYIKKIHNSYFNPNVAVHTKFGVKSGSHSVCCLLGEPFGPESIVPSVAEVCN